MRHPLLRPLSGLFLLMMVFTLPTAARGQDDASPAVGRDLLRVFQRAAEGAPLRVVNIGGSITQAGGGWAWDYLEKQLPEAPFVGHNAGLSGTGSNIGVYRIGRDVIAHQPDLVFIEFAVNDRYAPDAAVVRNVESMVRRLKQLPHPPAVVLLQAAFQNGTKYHRHEAVAEHYGLLAINLHEALMAELSSTDQTWKNLIADNTHPTTGGHRFYSSVIARRLAPYIEQARENAGQPLPENLPLPEPLSDQPLLFDGYLATLPTPGGWGKESINPERWDAQWYRTLSVPKKAGATMSLPVRGTSIGLFFTQRDGSGPMLVSLDGQQPRVVNTEGSIYGSVELAGHLEPREHLVTITLPRDFGGREPAPFALAYLMIAGASNAAGELAPQGPYTLRVMSQMRFEGLTAENWMILGPLGGENRTTQKPTADFDTHFIDEPKVDLAATYTGYQDKPVTWQPAVGEGRVVDLARSSGLDDRGVHYAYATVELSEARRLMAAWSLDYFGKLWLNGKLVKTYGSIHGSPHALHILNLDFKNGANTLLIKLHSGSAGNNFTFAIENPSDLDMKVSTAPFGREYE